MEKKASAKSGPPVFDYSGVAAGAGAGGRWCGSERRAWVGKDRINRLRSRDARRHAIRSGGAPGPAGGFVYLGCICVLLRYS